MLMRKNRKENIFPALFREYRKEEGFINAND